MKDPAGNAAPSGGFQNNGWYSGYNYYNGSFAPTAGAFAAGNPNGSGVVSTAVNNQTNPNNQSFINSENGTLNAGDISSNTSPGTGVQGQVTAAQNALQAQLTAQQNSINSQLATAQTTQDQTLASIQTQSTPFQEDYQQQQQQTLFINQNFQANQTLTSQLGDLLTQGNALIKQQQGVTGLASVRNPRVSQTMSDVAAQAGVIQAVLAANNNQIAQAQQIINTNVTAIQNDRNAQISYYQTVLQLNSQKIVSLSSQSAQLAQDQITSLQQNVTDAEQTANYVKQLLVNPATSQIMGQAGISLNDSVDTINQKLAQAQYTQEVSTMSNTLTSQGATAVVSPAGIPAAQLITMQDSKGVTHYYEMPAKAANTTSVVDSFFQGLQGTGSGGANSAPPTSAPTGGNGTIWVDPSSGTVWQYSNGQWELS